MKIGMFVRRTVAVGTAALGLAFLPGCFGDDESPDDATLTEAQDDVAGAVTDMAMTLDREIAEALPALFTDGVEAPPTRDQSVAWSEADAAWTITITETYEEDHVSGSVAVTQTVQFVEDGVPVQYPDAATDAVYVTVLGTNSGNFDPPGAWDADFTFTVDRTWAAQRDELGNLEIDGSGSVGGVTTYHLGANDHVRNTVLEWVTDLGYTAGNPCVSGTVVGSTTRHSFTAAFDGAGEASWEIVRDGVVVVTGNMTYTCAGPGA